MRTLGLVTALVLLAGCAPKDIARSSCESVLRSTGDEWSCTVTADVVGRASSLTFDTESRNQVAQVSIALRVTSGTVRVGYQDLAGQQTVVITPSEPANFAMRTRMTRDTRSFSLFFEPIDGPARGLAGTVKYSTP